MERKSGILLHISSLPGPYGIGDLGNEAYRWIDYLSEAGIKIWQILPLGPIGPGNSPYQAYSAYAGDPLYIAPDRLLEWGLLANNDLKALPRFPGNSVDFEAVRAWKKELFRKARSHFKLHTDLAFNVEFEAFKNEHAWWLTDYSLYSVFRNLFDGKAWNLWDEKLAKRDPVALLQMKALYADEMEHEQFLQFLFYRQWFRLKNYARDKGVQILGDVPLYVSHDCSDVWGNQELFWLNEAGCSVKVGGVPPDYFCEDGQLWGNPVFNWEKLKATQYQWWMARMHHNLHLYHYVRIDHFRGLESFWAIPFESETAKAGEWMPAYGHEMLALLRNQRGDLPVVAEDLGIITSEVEHLRRSFGLPGMKVLQFAFASDESNEHLPHQYNGRTVAYTGTHDNDTLAGWWKTLPRNEKKRALDYLSGYKGDIVSRFLEIVWASSAEWAIAPMQDLLKLGSSARMNVPEPLQETGTGG
ncbi:MAG TPA: 4-alpha-glucanotransferase [Prolixibacteraceae bacterium]|nr:4-alpha-glucanotransferase [Prolixibacteraceae bacterium]